MAGAVNADLAHLFQQLSVLAGLQGDDPFRARAYANAARLFETLEGDAGELAARGALTCLRGIGPGLAGLIDEYLRTGTTRALEEMRAAVPPGVLDLLRIPGLGPKKVRTVYAQLGVASISELEQACRQDRVRQLRGFGGKTQDMILRGIEQVRGYEGLYRVDQAHAAAHMLQAFLVEHAPDCPVTVAGSLRRRCELADGVDLVLPTEAPEEWAARASGHPEVDRVIAPGPERIELALRHGMPARLHLVQPALFPAALHHFTGSPEHLAQLRARARALHLELTEQGLFRDGLRLPCPDEGSLYAALGLSAVPPELREGRGELEAAACGSLPDLIEQHDLRGVLHAHTTFSDGRDSLASLAAAAAAQGYEYLGICDHSRSAAYAGGLSVDAVRRQHGEIDELNSRASDFQVFKGIESDILPDGSLDYDDEVLAGFDFVVASVHAQLQMGRDEMTRRIIRAVEHPRTAILGHPTGRLLLDREPYAVDLDAVLQAAARCDVAVEINAHPQRLDLDWRHVRHARDLGVRLAINPDAHQLDDLGYLDLGVGIARKGWLRPQDVLNTLDREALAAWFARRHKRV